MRSHVWLLAVSGHLAAADWGLEHKPVYAAVVLPKETQASNHDDTNGWTPKPTEAPAVELARRRHPWMNKKRQDDNTWLNDKTCGWRADIECKSRRCFMFSRLLLNKTGKQRKRIPAKITRPARPTRILSAAPPKAATPLGLQYVLIMTRIKHQHAPGRAPRLVVGELTHRFASVKLQFH